MIHEIKEGYVKSETHNGITTIEFHHPQSNSLPSIMLEELAQEIHSVAHDDDTKVIILRSAGDKAFCAGASFDELSAIKTKEEGLHFFNGFAQVLNAMRKCSKLIIGRIHGKCVGGGVGLVAATDYAIAIEGADVKLSELAIGIGPFVVGPAVERKIGFAAFSHLTIDATGWRNAEWAKRKGLYAELHPTIEGMDESVVRIANTISHSSTEAVAELKKIFWKGTENWDTLLQDRAAISGRLVLSEFSKNAIRKFRPKT
ncbi:MAG: enoyl-CoA hydratase/isomerase family protein [Chitinophagaceae bacterium]|nr:enoyl-CoA hydratase/isomerase family protein [Chitinophagaceae bacterium]